MSKNHAADLGPVLVDTCSKVESVLSLTYLESVDRIVVEDQGYFKTPRVIVSNPFTLSKATVLNQCVHNSIRAKI